jgi:glutaredoxin 3
VGSPRGALKLCHCIAVEFAGPVITAVTAPTPSTHHQVVLYTTSWCPYCARAKRLFESKGVSYTEIDIEAVEGARAQMQQRSGRSSVPQIFVGDRHLGGFDDTKALDDRGELDSLLASSVGTHKEVDYHGR